MAELIYELLRALREERGLSRSRLSRLTVRESHEGIGEKTIQALETFPGRVPDANIIEALARALDIPPERFYEYPIAVARRDANASTPGERDAARERMAQALREKAQQVDEHREGAPRTSGARRHRRGVVD